MDSIQLSTLAALAGKWQSEADCGAGGADRRAALRECADTVRMLCEVRFEDCPHAAPHRYCAECPVSPCPIGLGEHAVAKRGAVPDMYDRIAEAHDASLDEDHTGCRAILKECMRLLAAAPAPDQFRDAAKMMAGDEAHLVHVSSSDMAVYQAIADCYTWDTAPAPAEASGPDHEDGPDSEGFSGARPWNNHGDTAPVPAEVLGETCIDGGKCHHSCTDKCFRRECCVPLSGYVGPWAYAPAGSALPERDTTRPAEGQGLFRKFIVHRVDGSDRPGGKHHGCEYFVLDVDHDPHAPAGMLAYAQACATTHPELSADLIRRYGLRASAPAEVPMTQAATDVLAERQRQISAEGWTPDHDDEHDDGSLAAAAACYALGGQAGEIPAGWPQSWDDSWWRPSAGERRNLVKAGALILAEIERLDRADAASRKTSWLCPNCPTPDLCLRIQGCDRDEIAR